MGEGEGDDHASDGDSDSFFERNPGNVTGPRVVMPNATAHGVFHAERSCGDVGAIGDDWGYGGHSANGAGAHRGKDVYGVHEEDDDDDDEEDDDDDDNDGSGDGQQIEVRRRQQLSWTVHDVDDVDEDEDDEDEDYYEPLPLSESDDPGGGGGGGGDDDDDGGG